ncbi:MAG TPA: HEPN domain-containing protein [Draconibacterium sp.]|nr:HEPN domain-containing protein [Draconibacterium sp.]
MNSNELINYRLSRAFETYEEAVLLASENHWNTAANRLYYPCFYAVSALLLKNGLSNSTHNGVKTEFHKSFVQTGIISKQSGRSYSRLFNLRQEGDYLDFKRLEKEDVDPFFRDAKEFIALITTHINS